MRCSLGIWKIATSKADFHRKLILVYQNPAKESSQNAKTFLAHVVVAGRLFFGPLECFLQRSVAFIPFVKAGDVLFLGDFHKLLKSILD